VARAKAGGNGRLEEAIAILLQNQASFVARMAEIDARHAETERRFVEMERRHAEIERANAERFARIEALLLEHNRILEALPDVLRDKIGFKPPEQVPPRK
jgi:hypothetical protein